MSSLALATQLSAWGVPPALRGIAEAEVPDVVLARLPDDILSRLEAGQLPHGSLGLVGAPDLEVGLAYLLVTALTEFFVQRPPDADRPPDLRALWLSWDVLAASIARTSFGATWDALASKIDHAGAVPLLFLAGVGSGPASQDDALRGLLQTRRDAGLRTLWSSPLSAKQASDRYPALTPSRIVSFEKASK